MPTEIRFATPNDVGPVADLIDAMDRHYHGGTGDRSRVEAAASRWLSGDGSDARIVLAYGGTQAVGIAIFAILYPGVALTGLLFLKDLFVLESARNRGVGEALMRFLADYCVDHGLGRIDLDAARDDGAVRRFYDRLGGEALDWKISYRFGPRALQQLATGTDDASEG